MRDTDAKAKLVSQSPPYRELRSDRAVDLPGDDHERGSAVIGQRVDAWTLRQGDDAAMAELDYRLLDGATVGEVLAELGAETTEHETWLVARNEGIAERDHVLEPGDVLDCFEPLAGGAGRATREAGPCRYAM